MSILYLSTPAGGQEASLERSVRLGRASGALVTILDVIDRPAATMLHPIPKGGGSGFLAMVHERAARLEQMRRLFRWSGVEMDTRVVVGNRVEEVCREVRENGYGLVVVAAAPRRGLRERLFGNDVVNLIRRCPCPVWVMHPEAAPGRDEIAAAFPDARAEDAARVLEAAHQLARSREAKLHIVASWRANPESLPRRGEWLAPSEAESLVEDLRQATREKVMRALRLAELDNLGVEIHVIEGTPAQGVREVAARRPIDLVVFDAGEGASVAADRIPTELPCSVVAVGAGRSGDLFGAFEAVAKPDAWVARQCARQENRS